MKHSERLEQMRQRLIGLTTGPKADLVLTDAEDRDLLKAIKVIERIEAGQGFTAAPVVGATDGKARVDVCWMGMLANVDLDLARSIARELEKAASTAEHESILIRFLQSEVEMEKGQASDLLKKFREFRDGPVDNQKSRIIHPFSQN